MEDIGYVMSIGLFMAFILAMTTMIQLSFPEFQIITAFDFIVLGVGFIGVAGACVLVTGIPCAAAMGFFAVGSFIAFSTAVLWMLFTPLTLVMTFIIAKLARGTV